MKNKADRINDLEKNMFLKASLILISEELRILLHSTTNLENQYFKVFIASKDEENNTLIISSDNMKNQMMSMRLVDALNVAQIKETYTFIPWNANISASNVQKVLEENGLFTHSNYFLSRELYYPLGTNSPDSFGIVVMLKLSEWNIMDTPRLILKEFFKHFKKNIEVFLKTKIWSKISEIVNNFFNAESITRSVCEDKLNDLFGTNEEIGEGHLFDFICNLACKSYEGSQNKGVIRFASDTYTKNSAVVFQHPVQCSTKKVREIRKLLEMTDEHMPLIVKNHEIVGLGNTGVKNRFIQFEGNGKWKLLPDRKNESVFSVEGTVCTFTSLIDKNDFNTVFVEKFPEFKEYSNMVNGIIEDARKQKHGTSIVICDRAKEETLRLSKKGRAIEIKPISLIKNNDSKQFSAEIFLSDNNSIFPTENNQVENSTIEKITSIDGALIISPKGDCYAIGAILDGVATAEGDTGRGARYNSLNNYVEWIEDYYEEKKEGRIRVMAVVISEDQTIDYIPKRIKSTQEIYNSTYLQA